MKQLSSRVIYHCSDRSSNDKTKKTEVTEKTEFGMIESDYIPSKRTKKKKKIYTKNKEMRRNKRFKKYKNIHKYVNSKKNNSMKKKLTLYAIKRKLAKKTRRILPMARKLESLKKLLANNKKEVETNKVIEDLFHWSKRYTRQNAIKWKQISNELQVLPVGIVPPLPMPIWAKAMIESPCLVTVYRTHSMCHAAIKSKRKMKGRSKHGHRKHKHCMIHTESLTKVLASQRGNKGARQVPAATFRATKVHYRYLLAKYGKSGLMERYRVYPFVNKPSIHSNFSVINLLHTVEEAFTQNRYSKERDKIIRNFKEELNKGLFNIEAMPGKSHRHPNTGEKKRLNLVKHSSIISFSEYLETTNENVSNDFQIHKFVKEFEPGMEINDILFENRHVKPFINKLFMNSLTDSDSDEIFKSCSSQSPAIDKNFKTKSVNENIDRAELFSKKAQTIKENNNAKKKKIFAKEPKPEYITEEERLYAVMQELHKQLKASEQLNPLHLAKGDSLTDLNFEKEPSTYLSLTGSSSSADIVSSKPNQREASRTEQIEYIQADQTEEEQSEQTNIEEKEFLSIIKKKKIKKHHPTTKSYTFRIDYECIKDKPSNIRNILTALDRVNRLLQNIPIQYDANSGQPYIVYDPKTIIKVIAQVNLKHEWNRMVVKKYNKRTKLSFITTNKSIYKRNELTLNNSNLTTTQLKEENSCLKVIGNQLLNCILKSMKTEINSTANIVNKMQSRSVVTFTKSQHAITEHTQIFNNVENYNSQMNNLCNSMPCSLNQMSYIPNSLNYPWENRILVSPLTGKMIGYVTKYYYQSKKVGTNYQMAGIYYQIIVYMKRQEYVTANQPISYYDCDVNQGNKIANTIKKLNTCEALIKHHDINSTDMINNIKGHSFEYKYGGSIPYDLIEKHKKELQKVTLGKSSGGISIKYSSKYDTTKKHRLLRNELTRKYGNQRNELALKYRNSCYGATDNYKKNDYNLNLTSQENKYYAFKGPNEHNNSTYQGEQIGLDSICCNPVKLKNDVSYQPASYKIPNVTREKFLLFPYHKQLKGHKTNEQGKMDSTTDTSHRFKYLENLFQNQKGILLNPTNIKSEIQKKNSCSSLFMKNILKSASINTMKNTQSIRKNLIKQVFYFHIQQPATTKLQEIFNGKTPNEYFIPYPENVFSNFYNYKEQNKFHTHEKDINEQVVECVNKIKDELNENIENICKIININKVLLIKFLKICLQQKEFHFDKTDISRNLKKEINELKLQVQEQFDKKINPLSLITMKDKTVIREEKRIAPMINGTKIRRLIVMETENEESYEIINKNILSFGIISFFHFFIFIFFLVSDF